MRRSGRFQNHDMILFLEAMIKDFAKGGREVTRSPEHSFKVCDILVL